MPIHAYFLLSYALTLSACAQLLPKGPAYSARDAAPIPKRPAGGAVRPNPANLLATSLRCEYLMYTYTVNVTTSLQYGVQYINSGH